MKKSKKCGHVPHNPDTAKTVCEKCGMSVSLNEETRLWKVNEEMRGFCFLWSETGTEGGHWAMQEDGFIDEDGIHCSYYGLRTLEDGDDFTVYAEDGSVLWNGIICKDSTTGARPRQTFHGGVWGEDPTWKQQVVGFLWVHWVQAGIDPEVWGELFEGNKRCLLKRKDEISLRSS